MEVCSGLGRRGHADPIGISFTVSRDDRSWLETAVLYQSLPQENNLGYRSALLSTDRAEREGGEVTCLTQEGPLHWTIQAFGRGSVMIHDYKRQGTTTLFERLNALDGSVIGQSMQRHWH